MLRRSAQNPVKPVSISSERLIFTQSDMDASNFAVDEDGNTVLLDFGEIGVLPSSFVMFILSSQASFTVAVAGSLGWPGSANRALDGCNLVCLVDGLRFEPRCFNLLFSWGAN